MAEVLSTFLLQPGDPAPDFRLPDTAGGVRSRDELKGANGLLVVFACNHCPYVIHLADALGAFAREIADQGVNTVAIMPNDFEKYPDDAPEHMGPFAAAHGWNFPYLLDAGQETAKAYSAACTPDFFLFDRARRLVYRGQFDSSRPRNTVPVTGGDLRAACDAVLAGQAPSPDQRSSIGCNIKWKRGNEPEYFGRV